MRGSYNSASPALPLCGCLLVRHVPSAALISSLPLASKSATAVKAGFALQYMKQRFVSNLNFISTYHWVN